MPSDSLLIEMDHAMMSYVSPIVLDSLVNEYCQIYSKEDKERRYDHRKKIDELVEEKKVEKKAGEEITKIIETSGARTLLEQDEADYLKNFIEKYPKVSKMGRKNALYIRRGLDTAQIASEMNIRQESVMQARWRLRSQMGLSSDSDLEVELRKG